MKIYIAGKISGDDGYREKFRAAQEQMEGLGHIVLNPANNPEGMSKADDMRICFAMIDCADAVCFLPDWTDSPGARLEYRYCRYIGKQIMDDKVKEVEIGEIKSILAETLRGEIGKLADYLFEGGASVQDVTDKNVGNKWIPVTERLPILVPCNAGTAYSEAVNVLTSERKVLTAIWNGTEFIADAEFWEAEGELITHWTPVLLPLPEPPKEVSGSECSTV